MKYAIILILVILVIATLIRGAIISYLEEDDKVFEDKTLQTLIYTSAVWSVFGLFYTIFFTIWS